MDEELKQPQSRGESGNGEMFDSTQNYIDTINNLKKNTVSKEAYNKLLEENKNLLNTIVYDNGQKAVSEDKVVYSDEEIAKMIKQTSKDCSDLEYIKQMLGIRNVMMEKGLEDPFAPKVVNHTNDEYDYKKAQNVADFLQACVDESDGNPSTFKALFQAGMVDPKIPVRKK